MKKTIPHSPFLIPFPIPHSSFPIPHFRFLTPVSNAFCDMKRATVLSLT